MSAKSAAAYKQRKPWVRLVEYARRRCNGKHSREYVNAKYKGKACTINEYEVSLLWERDQARHMICPSLDRKDPAKGYVFENCRIIERDLNARLAWDKNIKLLPDTENQGE